MRYLYRCPLCGHEFDVVKSVKEADGKEKCTQCSATATRIILSTPFILQGDGWYKNTKEENRQGK
jgi:putative FmdB family regulatory protein